MRLDGQTAIITGSSRGLGQYCAVGYAKEGATVVIAARTEQETDPRLPGTIYHTAELVKEAGGEATWQGDSVGEIGRASCRERVSSVV